MFHWLDPMADHEVKSRYNYIRTYVQRSADTNLAEIHEEMSELLYKQVIFKKRV